MDGTGNSVPPVMFHGLLSSMSLFHWGWGGVSPELRNIWEPEAGGAAPRMEEDGGEVVVPSEQPPPPRHPAGLCLTAHAPPRKKLTVCFCLAARGLQAAGAGEVGHEGGLLPPHRMDFPASLLVGRAGTRYGRLLKE